MGFFGPESEYLFCLSQIETLSLWDIDEAQKVSDFTDIRTSLSQSLNSFFSSSSSSSELSVDYLIGCHYHSASQRLFLIAGTSSGGLALCHVNQKDIQICAFSDAPKDGKQTGHTDIIRDSLLFGPNLISGGQDGNIFLWNLSSTTPSSPLIDLFKKKKSESKKTGR